MLDVYNIQYNTNKYNVCAELCFTFAFHIFINSWADARQGNAPRTKKYMNYHINV